MHDTQNKRDIMEAANYLLPVEHKEGLALQLPLQKGFLQQIQGLDCHRRPL